MSSTASNYPASKLSNKIKNNPAYALFGGFLISIFFLEGTVANTLAVACFIISWILILFGAGDCKLPTPPIAPIVLAFLIASGLRLLLPPYGFAGAMPGSGVSHALLVAGLYGLALFAQSRLPFNHILWLLVIAATTCVIFSLMVMPQHIDRLSFIGRTSNPILGTGSVIVGLVAAIVLLAYHTNFRRAPLTAVLLATMTCCMLAGIYLASSRGPLLASALALGVTPLIICRRSRALLYACAFGAYALVAASVLFEASIRKELCPAIEIACRDPKRHDVWMQSLDIIVQHPLWGVGYAFRFKGDVPHAHNTYLGMALHYGIPLAIFFVSVMVAALSCASKLKNKDEKFFIVAMLIFANGFMASDLSEPLRSFNTHYLFLWTPIFLAFIRPHVAQDETHIEEAQRSAA